jgi:sugar/nucleoside kinase (ribokinase family)
MKQRKSRKHIVSVGDLVVDLIFPVSLPIMAGEHQDVGGNKVEPGGACNIMIAAARIGAQVSAIGAVGTDPFGTSLLQMLRDEGIDVRGVDAPPDNKTTTVLVLSDVTTHQHTFIGHYEGGSDAPYSQIVDEIVLSADALLIQGYSLYEQRVAGMVAQAMERAKAANIPVYFDAGPTLHIVSPDRIDWAVGNTDVVLMTEDEIAGVSGGRRGEAAFRYLLGRGVSMLVVKQGERGCTVIQQGYSEQFEGFQVPVVDTVGAGDSFDAGFITAQLSGHSIPESAAMANAMGAASVQKLGAGRSVPTCKDVNTILKPTGLQFSC